MATAQMLAIPPGTYQASVRRPFLPHQHITLVSRPRPLSSTLSFDGYIRVGEERVYETRDRQLKFGPETAKMLRQYKVRIRNISYEEKNHEVIVNLDIFRVRIDVKLRSSIRR